MMHTVHFSIAVASGTNLTYRLHGQVILNRDLAAHISHVPDTGELTRALIAVGLPPSIVARRKRGSTHEVTDKQLRDLDSPSKSSHCSGTPAPPASE
jgi:hypothetical protein